MTRMRIFGIYMVFVGILGQFVYFAQAYKIFITKSAHDLSMLAFSCGLVAACSWFVYGLIIRNVPLIITNMVAMWGAIAVMSGIILYG